jgi:hypothetical protein
MDSPPEAEAAERTFTFSGFVPFAFVLANFSSPSADRKGTPLERNVETQPDRTRYFDPHPRTAAGRTTPGAG